MLINGQMRREFSASREGVGKQRGGGLVVVVVWGGGEMVFVTNGRTEVSGSMAMGPPKMAKGSNICWLVTILPVVTSMPTK
jgi:hypothetical protein